MLILTTVHNIKKYLQVIPYHKLSWWNIWDGNVCKYST